MFFAQSELEQPLWTKAKHKFVLPREWRVKGLEDTVAWEFQRAAEVLAKVANMEIRQRNLLDYANRNFGRPAVNRMAKCRGQPLPGGREIH